MRNVSYSDPTGQKLYIGIVGKLDVTNGNAIGVFLNISGPGSPTGKAAGQSLGIQSTGGNYIGGGNDAGKVNFKADFEVDYLFAFNPGGGTNVYFDAAKHVASSVIDYQGSCNQTGTPATNSSATGTVFPANSVTFAFDNSGAASKGLEIAIPWSAIGADGNMLIQVMAFVVSADGYFSDVTVPGNVPPGIGDANLAYNPDFGSIANGPYHTTPDSPLPIQLSSFTGRQQSNTIHLDWATATETNNYGFYVQRKAAPDPSFTDIANSFIAGHGTTTTPQHYSFTDNLTSTGQIYYRLRQQDLDGSIHFSEPIQIDVLTGVNESAPREFSLSQNYPNPFNPSTDIKFSVSGTARTTLEVFNTLGQKVMTVFDGVAEAGQYYTVRMNASTLASGAYFYKLESGASRNIKRFMLLK